MPLAEGARFGSFELLGRLGAGGMGEVYRARDTQLGRDVALKVLPALFADDPERRARFAREARTLAALNHPHIAQIYGLELQDGVTALVMELVDGEDLAQRIARAPLTVEEAVAVARQIAAALEGAHEQGIIHRDLKPANIKVRADGIVKVLDFGLAKALEATGQPPVDALNSPTLTSPSLSARGTILGTAAYMSPEQARGQAVDERADIWAFGCVLYEMLTGAGAFPGHSVADTLAAVLTKDPEWATLPGNTPASIRRLLRRCMEKDPARRLRHIADGTLELDEVDAHADAGAVVFPFRLRPWHWLASAAVLASVAAGGLMIGSRLRSATPPALEETRVEVTTPAKSDPASFAMSPDGRTIAFVADDNGRPRLFLRHLDAVSAQPLAGTDGASFPFWSPNGRSIGFLADDSTLKRIDIDGGGLQVVANAPLPRGGSWNKDDVIIYVPATGPVYRVPAKGGEPTPVTKLADRQTSHTFPKFLSDGKHFIYHSAGAPDVRGIYLAALDGSQTRRLTDTDSIAAWIVRDHLLFMRGGSLYAQSLDMVQLQLTGRPVRVADNIATHSPVAVFNVAAVDTSDAGHILFRTGSTPLLRQFVWFDRNGKEFGRVGEPDDGFPVSPAWSPDRRQIATHRQKDGNVDIWLLDVARGSLSRFTTHAANEIQPLWSPKGDRIVFNSNRSGSYQLFEKSLGGSEERLLLPLSATSTDWSKDGTVILTQRRDAIRNSSIWTLPLTPGRQPTALVDTEAEEREAQFSPDGRWFAYSSTESGQSQIYVRPFPGPGATVMISVHGGAQPRWRADGKELFFIALDGRLMVVPITLPAGEGSPEAGTPKALFMTKIGGAVQPASKAQYLVSDDGSRFLMNTILDRPVASPITLILNWKPPQPGPGQ